jgi:hypothetical protein
MRTARWRSSILCRCAFIHTSCSAPDSSHSSPCTIPIALRKCTSKSTPSSGAAGGGKRLATVGPPSVSGCDSGPPKSCGSTAAADMYVCSMMVGQVDTDPADVQRALMSAGSGHSQGVLPLCPAARFSCSAMGHREPAAVNEPAPVRDRPCRLQTHHAGCWDRLQSETRSSAFFSDIRMGSLLRPCCPACEVARGPHGVAVPRLGASTLRVDAPSALGRKPGAPAEPIRVVWWPLGRGSLHPSAAKCEQSLILLVRPRHAAAPAAPVPGAAGPWRDCAIASRLFAG